MRGCSVIARALLMLAAMALALILYAWLASWMHRVLAWADNTTGWLLRGAGGIPAPHSS